MSLVRGKGQWVEADPMRWVAPADRRWRRDVVQLVAATAVFVATLVSPLRSGETAVAVVLLVLAWVAWVVALNSLANHSGPMGYPAATRIRQPLAPLAAGAVHEFVRMRRRMWAVQVVLWTAVGLFVLAGSLFTVEATQPAPPGGRTNPLGPAITFWVFAVVIGAVAVLFSRRPPRRIWLEGSVLHDRVLSRTRSIDLAQVSTARVAVARGFYYSAGLLSWTLRLGGGGRPRQLNLTRGLAGMLPAADYQALASALAANPDRPAVDPAIDELLDYAEISARIHAAGPRLRRPGNLSTLLTCLVMAAAVIAAAAAWPRGHTSAATAADPNGNFPSSVPLPNLPNLYPNTSGERAGGRAVATLERAPVQAQAVTDYRQYLLSHGWQAVCTALTITITDPVTGRKPGQPPLQLPATAYRSPAARYLLILAYTSTGTRYLAIRGSDAPDRVPCATIPRQF